MAVLNSRAAAENAPPARPAHSPQVLDHPTGRVVLVPARDGRWHVSASPIPQLFCPRREVLTTYTPELVDAILPLKGVAYLVDEIARDEDPAYTAGTLLPDLLAYVDEQAFDGKTVLDFGSGLGASTCILGRAFPHAQVYGIELNQHLLDVAAARARHHGLSSVRFLRSPSAAELPAELPPVDFIMLSAVYEHILPDARDSMLRLLWERLKPGGVMFIDQTPHRYFPVEVHTTHLPLINYLPDELALAYARRYSPLVPENYPWEHLLRDGIRGGTAGEILGRLRRAGDGSPELLEPHRRGIYDPVDLWYQGTTLSRWPRGRLLVWALAKVLYAISGVALVPYIALAIRKQARQRAAARGVA